jgi:E3 ubiquitin-protein ligase DOA10
MPTFLHRCRFCHEARRDDKTRPLRRICACPFAGRYAHEDCLESWLKKNEEEHRPSPFCEACGCRYVFGFEERKDPDDPFHHLVVPRERGRRSSGSDIDCSTLLLCIMMFVLMMTIVIKTPVPKLFGLF